MNSSSVYWKTDSAAKRNDMISESDRKLLAEVTALVKAQERVNEMLASEVQKFDVLLARCILSTMKGEKSGKRRTLSRSD